jgi:hypothetical protein
LDAISKALEGGFGEIRLDDFSIEAGCFIA